MLDMDVLLPPDPDEPKPYTVKVWRYRSVTVTPFVLRDDAIDFAVRTWEWDDNCSVEGVFRPDGNPDEEANLIAFPWRRRGY